MTATTQRANLLVILAVMACGLESAIGQQTDTAGAAPPRLAKQQVLITGNLPMFTAFGDVNGDSKLDMWLGSKGHEYHKGASQILQREYRDFEKTVYGNRKQLSFHLNTSTRNSVSFAEPYWLSDLLENSVLPSG